MTYNLMRWIHISLVLAVAVLTVVVISSCQITGPTPANTPISTTATTATATPRPYRTPTPAFTSTVAATETEENTNLTLTIWTVESISPNAAEEAGSFINNSLRDFERTHPDIDLNVVLKKPSGKGGILDFLRTSNKVAPTILPDVVILNTTDLTPAYTEGLIQSLNDKLDRSIVQDLLPAARRMGTVDNNLVAVPLGLEMEHTVYNTLTFTAPLVLWSDVLSSNTRYLFPAKGVNGLVNDTTLSFYFSSGGRFLDDQGLPTINERVLRDVLEFYRQALDNKVITSSALEASTTEELWPNYLQANAKLAQISVSQYITDQVILQNTSYAPLPVQKQGDQPVLITRGWAMALVTADLERQVAALNLIETFMSTENNAAWNTIKQTIPTRDSAYQNVAGDDPYWDYLAEQLNTAQPAPSFNGYDRIGRIIQQAVQQVINGEATPQEATTTAIDALNQ
jgi:ABC-type glycerol-3-phosphate transport system substrate-binding protein